MASAVPVKSLNALPTGEFYFFCASSGFLAMTAGYVNAVGMVGLSSTVTHMTGVITRIGWSVALERKEQLEGDFVLLFSFIFGAFIATAIVGPGGRWNLSLRYAIGFMISGTCLLLAATSTQWVQPAFVTKMLIACSMGLQNGMTSIWSAGSGRTTHLTGFLVDITIFMALFVMHCNRHELWRLKFVAPIFFGFMFGAYVGGSAFDAYGQNALIAPAIVHYCSAIFVLLHRPVRQYFATGRFEFGETDAEAPTVPEPVPLPERTVTHSDFFPTAPNSFAGN